MSSLRDVFKLVRMLNFKYTRFFLCGEVTVDQELYKCENIQQVRRRKWYRHLVIHGHEWIAGKDDAEARVYNCEAGGEDVTKIERTEPASTKRWTYPPVVVRNDALDRINWTG